MFAQFQNFVKSRSVLFSLLHETCLGRAPFLHLRIPFAFLLGRFPVVWIHLFFLGLLSYFVETMYFFRSFFVKLRGRKYLRPYDYKKGCLILIVNTQLIS